MRIFSIATTENATVAKARAAVVAELLIRTSVATGDIGILVRGSRSR